MNRRQFMQGILATACAPAIVRADSLMRIVSRDTTIVLPQIVWEGNWFADWMDAEIKVLLVHEAECVRADIRRLGKDWNAS